MTLQWLPRSAVPPLAPVFAAAFHALQRVSYDERPALWEDAQAMAPAGHAGERSFCTAAGGDRIDRGVHALVRAMGRTLAALDSPAWLVLPLHRRAGWGGRYASRPAYPPLRRARERLQEALPSGLTPGFNRALRFDAQGAAQAVPLWFWTARSASDAGGLWAAAQGLPLVASLCQYGNLHLSVYDAGLLQRIDALAGSCGWRVVDGPCSERFTRGPAVPGRSLVI